MALHALPGRASVLGVTVEQNLVLSQAVVPHFPLVKTHPLQHRFDSSHDPDRNLPFFCAVVLLLSGRLETSLNFKVSNLGFGIQARRDGFCAFLRQSPVPKQPRREMTTIKTTYLHCPQRAGRGGIRPPPPEPLPSMITKLFPISEHKTKNTAHQKAQHSTKRRQNGRLSVLFCRRIYI